MVLEGFKMSSETAGTSSEVKVKGVHEKFVGGMLFIPTPK